MADKAIITDDTQVKDVKEGTMEAEIAKVEVAPPAEAKHAPETVPLPVYLELKEDLKALKQELKDSKGSSKERVTAQGLDEISKKYPDVNEEFIKDILNSATTEATKKIEEKYSPIIERQETEKKQAAFDKAFDNLFEKTLKDNPELPTTIDKDAIKALASTPQYRNIPLAEILTKMYSTGTQGRSSSEDDTRSASDKVEDIVNFDKITPEQRNAVLDDPKARAKYFTWLDGQTGR